MKKLVTITTIIFAQILIFNYTHAQNLSWAKGIGSTIGDVGNSIAVDDSGNVYSTGYISDTADLDPGPGVYNLPMGGYISKLDASGNFIWAKQFAKGTTGSYDIPVIILDKSGNIYTATNFSGTVDFDPGPGTFNLISIGSADFSISKLDTAGNFIWAVGIGSTSDDRIASISTDNFGNIYATGGFGGTVDFDPGPAIFNLSFMGGFEDGYVLKLDSAGNFNWAFALSSSGDDVGFSVMTDVSGNVYCCGTFAGAVDFDPGPGTYILSATSADIFVQKTDSAGNFIWAKRTGSSDYDICWSGTIDSSANIYSTGFFTGTVDFDPSIGVFNLTDAGNGDVFIQKLDSSGNFMWARRIGGAVDSDQGFGMAADAYNNIYTTGQFGGTVDFDPGSGIYNLTGNSSQFILKLDASGNFVWAKGLNHSFTSNTHPIIADTSGNIFLTGSFSTTVDFDPDTGTFNLTSVAGSQDIYITKWNQITTTTATINPFACNSYTSPSGNYTWTTSGTYMDTIPNVSGYDSIITINLTISTLSTSSTLTISACNNYTSPSTNYNWTSSGTYMDTIPNAGGCDSVITINLTINNSTASSQTATACSNYLSPSGNYTWTASGIYLDTIPNAVGCDSVITVNLTINSSTSTQTIAACNNYISPSGNYNWTISGIYHDTIPNSFGCDSIITINLTIDTVNISVIQTGITLTANAIGATYQWLDCNNAFSIISGATQNIFTAAANGNYAVAITQNGCIDTSACFNVTGVGFNEINHVNNFEIFPNPASDKLQISLNETIAPITIYNLFGEKISGFEYIKNQNIDVSKLSSGIYFIEINSLNNVYRKKFVKL